MQSSTPPAATIGPDASPRPASNDNSAPPRSLSPLADHAAWHARYARRKRAEVARRCALFALDGGGEHLALVVLGLRDRTPCEPHHTIALLARAAELVSACAADDRGALLALDDRLCGTAAYLARCATRTSRLSLAIAEALAATIEAEQLASEACRAVAAAQGGAS